MARRLRHGSRDGFVLRARQLARLDVAVFDIPPRTRRILIVAGVAGLIVVVTESLIGGKLATIETDKILHFVGYGTLAATLVLGLNPRLYLPLLVALFGIGLLVEFIQPLNLRSMDMGDQYANTLGIVCGALLGLTVRGAYAYLRQDLAEKEVRRRLVRFGPGEIVVREGEPVTRFAVIRRGRVRMSRTDRGTEHVLGELGPGQVIGTVGVILGTPQLLTATAVEETSIHAFSLDDALESAGGERAPVGLVMSTMAEIMRRLSDDVVDLQAKLEAPRS